MCGAGFSVPPRESKRGRGQFCSRACKGLAKRRTETERPDALKRCSKCGLEFPATLEFFRAADRSGRLRGECASCLRGIHRESYERFAAQRKAAVKRYRETNRAKVTAAQRVRYRAHPEANAQRHREYYQANKGRYAEWQRRWRHENRDQYRQLGVKWSATRRARQRELAANLTPEDWAACLAAFDHRCAYCGTNRRRLEQDHFVPLTRGGAYTRENIVPACKSCNSSKNGADFFAWYPRQSFFAEARADAILTYLGACRQTA